MNNEKYVAKNFWLLSFEGALFFAGATAFMDSKSVIPVFINYLSDKEWLIGLASTMVLLLISLVKILSGPYIHNIKNMKRFVTLMMAVFRPLPLLLVPVLLLSDNNTFILIVFFFVFAALWISDGLIMLPWTEVFSRTIPPKKRGRVMGNQQLLGAIGGIIAAAIIAYSFNSSTLAGNTVYALLFGCAGFTLTLSTVFMGLCKDPNYVYKPAKVQFKKYYTKIFKLFGRNKDFTKLMTIRVLHYVFGMSMPFIIIFSKSTFDITVFHISVMINLQIAGKLIGGYTWGIISEKFGNKAVISVANITGIIIISLTLLSLISVLNPLMLIYPAMLIMGINAGSWQGYFNYIIDVVDEDNRSSYFVLSSIILLPVSFMSTIAGYLIPIVGYIPIFLVSGLVSVLGLSLSYKLRKPNYETDAALDTDINSV